MIRSRLHRWFGLALVALALTSIEPYLVVVKAAVTVVVSASAGSSDGATATTSGVNTSTATFIGLCVSSFDASTAPTPTDNKGNTFTPRTAYEGGASNSRIQLWYNASPSVGTGHTFSVNQASSFPSIAMIAAAGTHATPYDVENGTAQITSTTTIQTGSVTPSENNEFLQSCATGFDSISSVNSGFTLQENVAFAAGQHFPVGLAYKIQTSAGAENPTWTYVGNTTRSASIATFKQSAGGGATPAPRLLLLGVGGR